MSAAHVIEALGETIEFEYQGDPEQLFRGVATTTRGGQAQRRFWVMMDKNWTRNLHDPYEDSETTALQDMATALEIGAEGVICPPSHRGSPMLEGRNVFFTPNTIDFTCRLIEAQRRLVRGRRIIAVTGSAGKTSTTSMIAHALNALDNESRIQHNDRNRNYLHWALSYLSRAHRFDHTVLEISGAALSHRWDHYAISPDIAVVTSIAEAHLEYHGDLAGVARDKSNIFKAPPRQGAALINMDSPHSGLLIARAESEGSRVITYGENPQAHVRLVDYDSHSGRIHASVAGLDVQYALSAKGRHMALNSLAVLATLRDLGLDWATGMVSLETYVPPAGRGQEALVPLSAGGHFMLIDGSYNANPASLRASLRNLSTASPAGRKVAVLGDILELGEHAAEVHNSVAADIREANLDVVHILGENMHVMHDSNSDLAPIVHRWESVEDLIEQLPGELSPDDVLLIKGSGATGLKGLAVHFLAQISNDK